MRATIKEIAETVGVNVGTVSRALNDKPGVSPDLRRQIIRVADEMNYRPNGHARGLVTQRTETIGLLSGAETSVFLSDPFYAGVFAGIESETREHNYALMFASATGESPMLQGHLPKLISEHRVDGLLVVGTVESYVVKLLQSARYPFVLVDYHFAGERTDAVITNNVRGGRTATEHLLQLGHRHIAFIGGAVDHGNFGERMRGYREALEAAGIPFRKPLVQGGDVVGGYESMLRVLERAPEVTAVVACNDANALAAIAALRARGLEVPKDVSVVGFDDIPSADASWPRLTTLRVNKVAMGRKGTQRLVQKLDDPDPAGAHEIVFSAELVVRDSTAAPRKS
jgi:LacI family transcriptional regulator